MKSIKIYLFIILALSFSISLKAQIKKDIKLLNVYKTGLTVTENNVLSFTSFNAISLINTEEVNTQNGLFTSLTAEGYVQGNNIGDPSLPMLKKLIEIPQDAIVKVNIISYDEEIINLADYNINSKILPIQPPISKEVDPSQIQIKINNLTYEKNEFISYPIVSVENLGTMRSVRLGRLVISPVQYNPVQNKLKIFNNIKFEIIFENANIVKTNELKEKYSSPYFDSEFNILLNFKQNQNKDVLTKYPIKYVIVSDPMFQSALQPFINWKIRKGFNVIQAYTNDIAVGTTTTTIKAYLKNLYTSGTASNPAPTFVLFVGDIAQIPAFAGTANGGGHSTDFYYCEYTGDTLPEAYYGRFSAENLTELQAYIDKTMEYEQYTMPVKTFLSNAVIIAGCDAGNAPTYGNGQINYAANNYINSTHGYTTVNEYLYGSGTPITSDNSAAAAAIINDVSKGVGFVNYTAHGSPTGWADPAFSVSDVSGLANIHKYPLMIGNCCLSNKFDDQDCFGEEITKATNKGAYAYIGASNLSYWNEDYYWAVGIGTITATPTYATTGLGAYDKLFHINGEAQSDWFVTNGQIVHGGNLSVTAGGTSLVAYYWEIYHLMGDPSAMTYLGVPTPLTATYTNPVPIGTTTLTVTTVPGAYVAISLHNVLKDAKLANSSGIATLTFTAFSTADTADIVITKQNKSPYIGTLLISNGLMADFVGTPTSIVVGGTVDFTDLSSNNPTAWQWTFTGATSTSSAIQNPQNIKYNTAGNYTVKLVASKPGYSDTKTKTSYIHVVNANQLCKADFTSNYTTIFVGNSIDFYDLSTNSPDTWQWDFTGAATTSSAAQNPTGIIYNTIGNYTVKLVVSKTTVGIPDSAVKVAYIHVIDASLFDTVDVDFRATTARLIAAGDSVSFQDLSTGYPNSWQWSFENGIPSTSTQQNPQNIKYLVPGLWKVCLTAQNTSFIDSLCKTKYIVVTSSPWPNPNGYCDTVTNVAQNENPLTFRHLTPSKWGYFAGHNGYKVKTYAEKYENYTFSNISTIFVPVVKASAANGSTNAKVKFHVWSVAPNGLPGTDLGSVTRNINTFTVNIFNPVTFTPPINLDTLNGHFFVGFELYYPSSPLTQPQDTFAVNIGPNRGNGGENTLYCKIGTTGNWQTPSVLLNDILNTSLAIKLVGCLLGIDDNAINKEIKIYPNPSKDIVNVEFGDLSVKTLNISVYNIMGQKIDVSQDKLDFNKITLHFADKPEGIYFIKININNHLITRKITLIK